MHTRTKSAIIGIHKRARRPILNRPRIWTSLLAALHASRNKEAARLIHRHQDLIENFQGIELPDRGAEPQYRRRRRVVMVQHLLFAAVIATFALAHGFALYKISTVASGASPSLAAIARTGD